MFKIIVFIFSTLFLTNLLPAQPEINHISVFPISDVKLFDKLELRFQMKPYSNNYNSDVIKVDGIFTSPSGRKYTVPGFYYVDYTKLPDYDCGLDLKCELLKEADKQPFNWIIRFTPNETGTWTYVIKAKDSNGVSKFSPTRGNSFECTESNRSGFFTKRNNRYLQKGNDPIFLVGTNVCWYGRDNFSKPIANELGTNDYVRYFDILKKNDANFTKVWIGNPASMSLTGREWTTNKVHGFDDYNQKDAWQLDRIFELADQNDLNIILCVFQQNTLVNTYGVNNWKNNNAFNSAVNPNRENTIDSPFQFFSNVRAKKLSKDLLRYIIARWGYATNLVAWKLFTEIEQVEKIWGKAGVNPPNGYLKSVFNWHAEMADYIRKIDPFNHLITTSSPNKYSNGGKEFPYVFYHMDLTVSHDYIGFKSLNQLKRFEIHLLNRANGFMNEPGLQDKPYMSQEWGVTPGKKLKEFDPVGYQFHNCLWASSFTGAFGSVLSWEWDTYLVKQGLFKYLKPVSIFMNSIVAQLDGTTRGYKEQMNGMTVFYATNDKTDVFIGWCQDDNYDFSRVKETKYVKNLKSAKPRPAGKKSIIKLPAKKNKQTYTIRWYDTQSAKLVQEETVSSKGYKVKFSMPQSLRTSTFGDGAFIITTGTQINSMPSEESSAGTATKRIKL